MKTFWIWGVRNPCVALAGLATLAGLTATADWSLATTTVLVLGVVGEAANHLARRAAARRAKVLSSESAIHTHERLLDDYRGKRAA